VIYHTWLIGWDGVMLAFCLGWPQFAILHISACEVGGITGVSHCTCLAGEIYNMYQMESITSPHTHHSASLLPTHSRSCVM
jgi:hypothetical protein